MLRFTAVIPEGIGYELTTLNFERGNYGYNKVSYMNLL